MTKYKIGDTVWIVENNACAVPVTIRNFSGGFYLVVKDGTKTALRLREHRLFGSMEAAVSALSPARTGPHHY